MTTIENIAQTLQISPDCDSHNDAPQEVREEDAEAPAEEWEDEPSHVHIPRPSAS